MLKAKNIITIEVTFPIALRAIQEWFIDRKKDADIVSVLKNHPRKVSRKVKSILADKLKKEKPGVKLMKLSHDYNDSSNTTHGVAYFKAVLKGTQEALRGIAGEGNVFEYDWNRPELSANPKTL